MSDFTWKIVLNPAIFMQIYNTYLIKHENCAEYSGFF